jgi:hypothetical protein
MLLARPRRAVLFRSDTESHKQDREVVHARGYLSSQKRKKPACSIFGRYVLSPLAGTSLSFGVLAV